MTFDFWQDTKLALYRGGCVKYLQTFPEASIDAVVTDPPYGLSKEPDMAEVMAHWLNGDDYTHTGSGFMGKTWDSFVPGPSVWKECLRVLKPGGHLLCFAGSRTQDLMGLAIRLAGFEIRDSIAWLYGSGFPKSLDVSKAIDKAAGAEREVVGLSPDSSNRRAVSFQAHDNPTGYNANPEGPRVITSPATEAAQRWQGWGTALKPAFEPIVVARKPLVGTVAANVLEHGTGAINIDACRTEGRERTNYGLANSRRSKVSTYGAPSESADFDASKGRWPTNVALDDTQAAELDNQTGVSRSRIGKPRGAASGDGWGMTATGAEYDDEGGASRFFPVFKYQAKAPARERPKVDGVSHPTVKPLDLMLWLVDLVTPPEGVVLDPFAGSGTTLEAALLRGHYAVGIEGADEYILLILERMRKRFPEYEL